MYQERRRVGWKWICTVPGEVGDDDGVSDHGRDFVQSEHESVTGAYLDGLVLAQVRRLAETTERRLIVVEISVWVVLCCLNTMKVQLVPVQCF